MRPAVWSQLDEQLAAMASPGKLAAWVWPQTKQSAALSLIDAHLVQAASTPGSRLIITMPPQEGKSQRVSRDFVLWTLKTNPQARIIAASYAQDLASRNARAVRAAIRMQPKLGLTLQTGSAKATDWRLDNGTGGLRAVGIGGGVSGFACDLLVVDDPIKSMKEAYSATYRETVWQWWQTEAASRLSAGGSVVVILTRWHEDDLAGRLIKDDPGRWTVLNIPAQCEDPETDPLGRAAGEYLASVQGRTREQWEQRKREAGPAGWQALYQGSPTGASGSVFKREWWPRWKSAPVTVNSDGAYVAHGFGLLLQSWDFTFKDGETNDWVVGQVWGVKGSQMMLLDQVRDRMDYPASVAALKALSAKWPQAGVKLVEDKANGSAVIATLRMAVPGMVAITPTESKYVRAATAAPFASVGNVWLPDDDVAPWVGPLVTELSQFPAAQYDDQVDTLTQAVRYVFLGDRFAQASGDQTGADIG